MEQGAVKCLELELLPFYLASLFKSLRNHISHQVGGLFGGTLMVGLITEPLGFVQDARDVMVLFVECV